MHNIEFSDISKIFENCLVNNSYDDLCHALLYKLSIDDRISFLEWNLAYDLFEVLGIFHDSHDIKVEALNNEG